MVVGARAHDTAHAEALVRDPVDVVVEVLRPRVGYEYETVPGVAEARLEQAAKRRSSEIARDDGITEEEDACHGGRLAPLGPTQHGEQLLERARGIDDRDGRGVGGVRRLAGLAGDGSARARRWGGARRLRASPAGLPRALQRPLHAR